MNVECVLAFSDQRTITLTKCLRFSLLRDRYQAFAALSAQFFIDDFTELPDSAAFRINGQLVFYGIVLESACIHEKNTLTIRFTSRSFTSALLRNQLVPDVYFNVTLQSLMETYHLPKIEYDDRMDPVRYVVVKENTAMWDTIVAYNYKLCGGFPYIRVPNLLCMMPQTGDAVTVLPADRVIAARQGGSCSEMISRIDMANAAGEYGSYTLENPEAVRRGIVRNRQIRLDKQYLYDPPDALRFRIALGNRRLDSRSFRYIGYCGEDLEDLCVIGSLKARVSRILITGSEKGIFTEDTFYFDSFCNLPEDSDTPSEA
ncbi:MAG: hypothetical protein MJ065_08975 [Oscillospiraceae bacterium]|nr:hypothetical protein [Oscillospiraceae bacterium]